MSRKLLSSCLVFLGLVPALAAQTHLTGQTESGAYYNIMVPDGWTPNDGLVIWNHGFDLSEPEPEPDLGPLAQLQLSEGYAVAASSYSLSGWAVFQTPRDNREMMDVFEAAFGAPSQILINGASLGGIVTARDLEEGHLGNVVGAMPICGAMAGSRLWQGAVDLRLLYDLVCEGVPGAAIPGGAAGLPFPPDPGFDSQALALAVNECTGLLNPPSAPVDPGQAVRLQSLLDLTGLPPSFLITDMGFATFGLADLVYDPAKLGGQVGFGNAHVDYGDPLANLGVERVTPDPGGQLQALANYVPSGKVGDVKIVSIHTDKDGLVLVENQSEYASVVPPRQLTTGIVVEDEPSHCGFSEAETVAAWESLRGWVAGLPKPQAADLQATCLGLDAGGLAQGPCRYDPGFVVPDLDDRVRPRDSCLEGPNTLCLNDGRFRVASDWEDFGGRTGPGWTMPQTNDSGSFWFFQPDNIEMTVKVLDGRQYNGRFWVFYGSLTNVEFELTVTDTDSGLTKVYRNESGSFASVGDTNAF